MGGTVMQSSTLGRVRIRPYHEAGVIAMRALDYRTKLLIVQKHARRMRVTKIAKELGIGRNKVWEVWKEHCANTPQKSPTSDEQAWARSRKEIPEAHLGWGPYSEARLQHLLKNSALGDAVRRGEVSSDELQHNIAQDLFMALRDGAVSANRLTPAELNAAEEVKQEWKLWYEKHFGRERRG